MPSHHGFRRYWPGVMAVVIGLTACSSGDLALGATRSSVAGTETITAADPRNVIVDEVTQSATDGLTNPAEPVPEIVIAGGVARRDLQLDETGSVIVQLTPLPLRTRALATNDTLPAPPSFSFRSSITELAGDPLERSTWTEDCPVGIDELRYVTVSFVGFDGLAHTGEMIVHADHAQAMVSVFQTLFEARYPIEEMRIVEAVDLLPPSDGDVNNTTAFVCRRVTGTTTFSQHAYGLAVDINPFQNPYVRRTSVIPPLAMAYADRSWERPGMIAESDLVVTAFDAIGWEWGGHWNTLKDYQHFSRNGR
ncbi:MAG: M15 family metallopeptidase [Acidimicrobiales bacterium]|nr:M15 family metallopeptidase [Acidimicrobiales bacterium]